MTNFDPVSFLSGIFATLVVFALIMPDKWSTWLALRKNAPKWVIVLTAGLFLTKAFQYASMIAFPQADPTFILITVGSLVITVILALWIWSSKSESSSKEANKGDKPK